MLLHFPDIPERKEFLSNYELFTMPNGIYHARNIEAENYLYPMYFFKEKEEYIVSTSVYALINYKQKFIRNPKFNSVYFFYPSFLTIDQEIRRARTKHRRSTYELNEPTVIIELGARLIQEYITEIENKYPGYIHVLSMGGKDSQNVILTKRNENWIVLSGEPNTSLNKHFIEFNKIHIHDFIGVSNETDNSLLLQEIIASDCFFDVAHFRYVKVVSDLVKKYDGRVVLWMGTSGDGVFKRNNNHRDKDYYAVHDLHVGMAMGIQHQVFKNLFDIPVVSPYQSPQFLDKLFYKFNPYFVDKTGDVRAQVGELLLGRTVMYPESNPTPKPWARRRTLSIPLYLRQLRDDGIVCINTPLASKIISSYNRVFEYLDRHSNKRRTRISKVLFPLRRECGKVFPFLRIKRHDISAREMF